MLFGYARVSTTDQNPDHQIDALLRAGVTRENIHPRQVEEPLQIRLRHRAAIAAIGRRLLSTQKLHRHGPYNRSKTP